MNREIAIEILKEYGFRMETAENGQEAVNIVSASRPGEYDLILMDIQMPVLDGIEAAEEIRAVKKRYSALVPIVAMTADAFINDNCRGVREFCDYIIKPVKPEELYAKLVHILLENDRGTSD